jgi:hypothetical protein
MTKGQALREARKRWGKSGAVAHRPNSLVGTHRVGNIEFGAFLNVRGMGDSWESAFAAADKTASSLGEARTTVGD